MRRKTVFYKAQEGDGRRNATRNCTPRGGTHHHGTHRPHGDDNTDPPPQAHADNAKMAQTSPQTSPDDNIEISIPTSVPCLVKADGTIIAPTAETWKIRNDSPSTRHARHRSSGHDNAGHIDNSEIATHNPIRRRYAEREGKLHDRDRRHGKRDEG